MPYAVILTFDAPSEAMLDQLGERLGQEGVSGMIQTLGLRPHLSLAGFESCPVAETLTELRRFAQEEAPFELQLAASGVFPSSENVLFLAPIPTRELLDLHARFLARLERLGVEVNPLYRPGSWMPHVTVAMDLPELHLPVALAALERSGAFFRAGLVEAALLEYPPFATLESFPLGG